MTASASTRSVLCLVAAILAGCATPPESPAPGRPAAAPTARAGREALPSTRITADGAHRLRLDYDGFTLWLDCTKRGAVRFEYAAHRDIGNEPRLGSFRLDPDVPADCQQTRAASYGHGYDRGHQVPANHLDFSAVAIAESNYMTNILPQTLQLNRGAWLRTEEIIECWRDIEDLTVIGGVIWGNNPADDFFVESHGVKTPDAFWKVVIRADGEAIAWIIPNTREPLKTRLDNYLVAVVEIEEKTGETLPVTGEARTMKPAASWELPAGCDRG